MNTSKLKIEYHIVDECNLNCRACSHFSCLVKNEKQKTLTKIKQDFAKIYELTNKGNPELVEKVTILGGEPLMYKKLNSAIKYIRSLFKDVYMEIVTNGILLPKMDDEFYEIVRNSDITICLSYYEKSKINYDKISKLLNSKNIKWYSYTMKGVFDAKFLKLEHDNNYENNALYRECRWRYNCTQLVDNKLYLCPLIAYFKYFDEEFKEQHNITINESDYIDLNKINSFEELQIERDKIPHFCGYCRGLDKYHEEWGLTKRDIEEWVYLEKEKEEEKEMKNEKIIFTVPITVKVKNNIENMMNFSIIIVDKNVENTLPRILNSLTNFKNSGGEVCFLDYNSTDNTVKIANDWGCKTQSIDFTKYLDDETTNKLNEKFNREDKPLLKSGDSYLNYSEIKNHAATLASNNMILMIDCNCTITKFDFNQISKHITENYNKLDFNKKYQFYNKSIFKWENNQQEVLIINDNEEMKSFFLPENTLTILPISNVKNSSLVSLALDCYSNQNNDKFSQQFAIELINNNFLQSAYAEFNRHLSICGESKLDRSRSLIYIGDYFDLTGRENEAIDFYIKAHSEYSNRRLALYKIGIIYYRNKTWDKCILYLEGCLSIDNFNPEIDDLLHYKEGPYAMLYVAYWWLGNKEKSKFYFDKALELNKYDKVFLSESKFHYEYSGNDYVGSLSFKEIQFLYSESKKYNSILEIGANNDRGTHALLNGCKGIVTVLTKDTNNLKNVQNYGNLRIITNEEDIKEEKFDMIIINCEGISHSDVKWTILKWEFKANRIICGYNYKTNKAAVDETIEVSNVEDNLWLKHTGQFRKQIIYKSKFEPTKNKKKKIALCLSGYLRTFKECYPTFLENLIQDYDVDIFIHTYDKIGNSSGWRSPIDLSQDLDMAFLETIPNIKVIVTEKWDDIKHQFEKFKELQPYVTNITTIATIFYKIYQCNEIRKDYEREHNIKYDLIIRTRGDLVFEKKINLNFPENKLLINSYPWGDEDFVDHYQQKDEQGNIIWSHENECLNDRFCAGNSNNIDYLCNLYNHFGDLIKDSPCVELEYLLYKYLNNIVELEKRNLNFYIKHNPPRLIKP